MVYFLLGVIIGILVRDIKFQSMQVYKKVNEYDWQSDVSYSTQFLESKSVREKFDEATGIDDLLD